MIRHLALFALCLLGILAPLFAGAQTPDTVRVCTYNLLQFGDDDIDRLDEFRLILNAIRPHILAVQEVFQNPTDATGGVTLFQDSVAGLLDLPLRRLILWKDGSHEQVMLLIDTTRIQFVSGTSVANELTPRNQSIYLLRIKGTDETFSVATGHWKAGDETSDATNRGYDARDVVYGFGVFESQKKSTRHILAGDLNVYSSAEQAYKTLMNGTQGPRLHDPINRPGAWHDNPDFADIHTQSTRARQFGGGVHGGLDDRFDQILISASLLANVLPATYTTLGNDGQHFNDSINAMPNTAVSAELAQALHDASDHLPVFVDFVFGATSDVWQEELPDTIDLTDVDWWLIQSARHQ